MKKLVFMLIILVMASCSEWDDEEDFRNYLRDKHPYSQLIEVDFGSGWTYQVNDTIKGEIWIYNSSRGKNTVINHCVICKSAELNQY